MLTETEEIAFQAAKDVGGGIETEAEARRRLDRADESRLYQELYCYNLSDRFG